jgi:hypothetical protein
MTTTPDAAAVAPGNAGTPTSTDADDRRLLLGRWGLWLALVGLVTILAGILFGQTEPLPPHATLAYSLARDDWQGPGGLSLIVRHIGESAV